MHVAEHTITVELGAEGVRTFRRTTTQAVRSIKAHRPRKTLDFMTPSEKLVELLC